MYHAWNPPNRLEINPEWKPPLQRCIYAFTVLYSPAIMATKTSILILYYRMGAAHPFLRYASLSTMAVVNIAGVVLTFLCIFQCHPVNAAFSPNVEGTCIDIITLYLSSTPINILTDVAILVLPLPILTSLRMEFRQKVILVLTFIIGGFVTVVGVVRIVYLQDALKEELLVAVSASTGTATPPNFTYYASFSLMWSVVEVSVGIMCCCILVLKPLVMRVMPRLINGPRMASVRPALVSHSSTSKARWSHSSTPSIHMPVGSPAAGVLRLVDSPVSPLSPGCFALPAIQEQPDTLEGAGDSMDFFQMLADNPPTPPPSDSLRSPLQMSSRREPTLRRMTLEGDLRQARTTVHTVHTDLSQGPTQTFFDFVQVKSRTPLTRLTAREAWWPILIGESHISQRANISVHSRLSLGLCQRSCWWAQCRDTNPTRILAFSHYRPEQHILLRLFRRPFVDRLLGPQTSWVQGHFHHRTRHLRHGIPLFLAFVSPTIIRRLRGLQFHVGSRIVLP